MHKICWHRMRSLPHFLACAYLYSCLLVCDKVSWLPRGFCMFYTPLCVSSTRVSPKNTCSWQHQAQHLINFHCFCLDERLMQIMHPTKKKCHGLGWWWACCGPKRVKMAAIWAGAGPGTVPAQNFLISSMNPLICILSVALPKIWWLLGCFHIFYAGGCVTIALKWTK